MHAMVWVVMLSDVIIATLLIALAFPLIQRKVKPNYWYGFRIPRSFRSEDHWYRINEFGGRLQLRAGVGLLLLSPTALLLDNFPDSPWLVMGIALVPPLGLIGWMVVGTLRYARTLD